MEQYNIFLNNAKNKIRIADHILTQTYPLLKDSKLFLAVIDNIYYSLISTMDSLLEFCKYYKKISNYQDNFDSKYNMFRLKLVPLYKIDPDIVKLIQTTKEIVTEHKKSSVEFTRKDVFVICSNSFKMKTLTLKEMKDYIKKTKIFIDVVNSIITIK